jgi:hypothetical protein
MDPPRSVLASPSGAAPDGSAKVLLLTHLIRDVFNIALFNVSPTGC